MEMKGLVCALLFVLMCFQGLAQLASADLIVAVKNRNYADAKACLEAGVSANSEEIVYIDYSTKDDPTIYETRVRVLYYAVSGNDTAMARLLLEHGASPNKGRWFGRDTTDTPPYRYDRGGFSDIIGAVVEGDDGGRMRRLLKRYDAKTREYQTGLGMRISSLAIELRKNADSLRVFEKILADNPDQIDFPDQYWMDHAVSTFVLFDVLSGLKYIVEHLHPDLSSKVWMIPGMNFLTKTWREEKFEPFQYVFYGDDANIEMIDYVVSLQVLTADQIKKGLFQNKHLNHKIRKYYELKAQSETPEMQLPENAKKKARTEKRMNKLYIKVQKQHPSV